MKKYRVEFTYQHNGYYEIEARNTREAEEIAEERFSNEEEPTYKHVEGSGISIHCTTPIKKAEKET